MTEFIGDFEEFCQKKSIAFSQLKVGSNVPGEGGKQINHDILRGDLFEITKYFTRSSTRQDKLLGVTKKRFSDIFDNNPELRAHADDFIKEVLEEKGRMVNDEIKGAIRGEVSQNQYIQQQGYQDQGNRNYANQKSQSPFEKVNNLLGHIGKASTFWDMEAFLKGRVGRFAKNYVIDMLSKLSNIHKDVCNELMGKQFKGVMDKS